MKLRLANQTQAALSYAAWREATEAAVSLFPVTISVQRTANLVPSGHPVPVLDARSAPKDSINHRRVRHLAFPVMGT